MPTRRRRYSERTGLRSPVRLERQFRDLDQPSRTAVWNLLFVTFTEDLKQHSLAREVLRALYTSHYEGLLGTASSVDILNSTMTRVQVDMMSGEWPDIADVLEAVYDAIRAAPEPLSIDLMGLYPSPGSRAYRLVDTIVAKYEDGLNEVFEREHVDHRMRSGSILDIDGEAEAEVIELALAPGGPFTVAQKHLEAGLRALSDRDQPNTIEAIREAIHGVESAARTATGASTLGDALNELARRESLHPALVRGWRALYGWTSEAGGVRHGDSVMLDATPALARWMLVSAAAFVTYLQSEHEPVN